MRFNYFLYPLTDVVIQDLGLKVERQSSFNSVRVFTLKITSLFKFKSSRQTPDIIIQKQRKRPYFKSVFLFFVFDSDSQILDSDATAFLRPAKT